MVRYFLNVISDRTKKQSYDLRSPPVACPRVTPAVPYVFMSYKRGVIAYYGTQAVHGVRAPEALGENLVCASP